MLGSLLLGLASITIMIAVPEDCTVANLKAAIGVIFVTYSSIFVLLLLQVVGLVKCLKKIPKVMFGFYVGISIAMFLVQMMLFTAPIPINNTAPEPCHTQTPLLYYWLLTQVIIFYLIVSFGLATWGSYLCASADLKEEVTKRAVEEYLAENKQVSKHFAIKAGSTSALLLEAPPKNDLEAQQR